MTSPNTPKPADQPGLLRSIGQFVGHIVDGIQSNVDPPGSDPDREPNQSVIVRHEVEERERQTPGGIVRVRRTVIEEISIAVEPARPEGLPGTDSSVPEAERG